MLASLLPKLALLALALSSIGYSLLAAARVAAFHRRLAKTTDMPGEAALTVLKPLCGDDPELFENLCSFCEQDHDRFQVLFGVREEDDPAIAVVHAVMARYPELDLQLIVDAQTHGSNFKVGNLVNLYPHARHDILVISDSDMRVTPEYLRRVASPFSDQEVGAATCLYRGRSLGGVPSDLLASYINEWFYPSALLSIDLGELGYCFGATIAVRRSVVSGFGGLEALADHLADDYMLGRLTVAQGQRVALCEYVVDNVIRETSLRGALLHELRWARTISRLRPLGFALSFVTDTLVVCLLAAIGLLLAGWPAAGAAVLALGVAARTVLHSVAPSGAGNPWWTIPLHDGLTFAVRLASFFGSGVVWRGRRMQVRHGGGLQPPRATGSGDDLECRARAKSRTP